METWTEEFPPIHESSGSKGPPSCSKTCIIHQLSRLNSCVQPGKRICIAASTVANSALDESVKEAIAQAENCRLRKCSRSPWSQLLLVAGRWSLHSQARSWHCKCIRGVRLERGYTRADYWSGENLFSHSIEWVPVNCSKLRPRLEDDIIVSFIFHPRHTALHMDQNIAIYQTWYSSRNCQGLGLVTSNNRECSRCGEDETCLLLRDETLAATAEVHIYMQ